MLIDIDTIGIFVGGVITIFMIPVPFLLVVVIIKRMITY